MKCIFQNLLKINSLLIDTGINTKGYLSIQSTLVISRQLGAKIRERELSGSPVILRFRAKATIHDLLDYRPTFSSWQLPNWMLSDNSSTYISRISTHIDIAPVTNRNKPH